MTLSEFRADLRRAYVGGGPGAVVSGLVWLVAAIVTARHGVGVGYSALFFGGFLIFPLGMLAVKLLFRPAPEAKGNPGGALVMETLPAMLGVLAFGFLLVELAPDWVFPLAAIAVGAHYFPFRTAYGDRTYWALGAAMTSVGALAIWTEALEASLVPWLIAALEIAFGTALTLRHRRAR